MPIENAEAMGGWRREGRTGMMIDESKTATFRREIVLISGDKGWVWGYEDGGECRGDFNGRREAEAAADGLLREAISGDMVVVWLNG